MFSNVNFISWLEGMFDKNGFNFYRKYEVDTIKNMDGNIFNGLMSDYDKSLCRVFITVPKKQFADWFGFNHMFLILEDNSFDHHDGISNFLDFIKQNIDGKHDRLQFIVDKNLAIESIVQLSKMDTVSLKLTIKGLERQLVIFGPFLTPHEPLNYSDDKDGDN